MTAEQEKAVLETGLRGYQELRCGFCEWMHLTIGGEAGLGLDIWLNLGFEELQKKDEETALMESAAASISYPDNQKPNTYRCRLGVCVYV